MIGKTVPVTVEWALWGTGADGAGHRLQACSSGSVDGESFEGVLARYQPGTLVTLPQVTIGWLADRREGRSFITLAVHDEDELVETDGRRAVLTRLFCVLFDQLAAGSVSYAAMYQEFGTFELPLPGRSPLSAELPTSRGLVDRTDPLAWRVAALLLTTKPVCILGADRVAVDERLRFIDTVASLLPYGLRSRLSASTWVSGTFKGHKLRLFFTSAARTLPDPDNVVLWGRPDESAIGHKQADRYLRLLSGDDLRLDRLADFTEQVDFRSADIDRMLGQLTTRSAPARPELGPVAERPELSGPARHVGPLNDRTSIDELLTECDLALDHGDQELLGSAIDRLREHLGAPATEERRRRYAMLIEEHRLLRSDALIAEQLLGAFYEVLLRLTFAAPLSYHAYCRIEACSGSPEGQPMHEPLLRAMWRVGLKDAAQLLVAMAIGDEEMPQVLRQSSMQPGDLVSFAASPQSLPRHARIMCEIIARSVPGQAGAAEHRAFQDALRQHGYLAPMLQERLPADADAQLYLLSGMLRAVYGSWLGESAIQDVLGATGRVPTIALLAALLRLASARDTVLVERQFTNILIAAAGFGSKTRRELDRLLRKTDDTAYPGAARSRPTGQPPAGSKIAGRVGFAVGAFCGVAASVAFYFLFIK